jgi:hypothetical protein
MIFFSLTQVCPLDMRVVQVLCDVPRSVASLGGPASFLPLFYTRHVQANFGKVYWTEVCDCGRPDDKGVKVIFL